ncbi:GNAT family N-acetyltransferase [Pseudonocardia sp. CA-107938]|uniref:GNAT family N-acetyltransferase n=1 Tax=Pseudonocardia sp. CA-107938 TaxID=3240021 RepID=UPI003D8CC1CB
MRETERLVLTPVRATDAAVLFELHRDPGIAPWYALTPEEAAAWVDRQERGWREHGVGKWLAHDRVTGELIGRGGCSVTDIDGEQRVEVGWAVRERFQRRGYATEIGRAGIDFARDELGAVEVVAFTEVHNRASRAVMETLGMTYVRELRRPGLIAGSDAVHDDAPFALYTTGKLNVCA